MNLQMRRVVSVQQRNIGNPGFKSNSVRISTAAVHNFNQFHGGSVLVPKRDCLETASVHSGTKCTSRWHSKQQQRRATITCAAQTSSEAAGFSFKDWDAITAKLVALSTVPFIFLLMPQIIKNAVNMLGGNTQALSILSWVVSISLSALPGPEEPVFSSPACNVMPGIDDFNLFSGFHYSSLRKHNAGELLRGQEGEGGCIDPIHWGVQQYCDAGSGKTTLPD